MALRLNYNKAPEKKKKKMEQQDLFTSAESKWHNWEEMKLSYVRIFREKFFPVAK